MAGIEPAPLSESVMSGWATQLPSLALYLVLAPGLEPGLYTEADFKSAGSTHSPMRANYFINFFAQV